MSKVSAFMKENKQVEAQADGVEDSVFWKALDATFAKWEEEDNSNPKKDLVKGMIHIHCDMMRQFLQFRQHHWHVQGIIFRDIHLFYDECSDDILESIDRWAERIVAFGAIVPTDPATIEELSDIPVIAQESRDPEEILQQTLDGLNDILDDFKEVNDLASDLKEVGIQNIAGDVSETFEKMVYKTQAFLELF